MAEKRYVVDIRSVYEFDRLSEVSPEFLQTRSTGEKTVSLFPYIMQDIFYALYQDFIKINPTAELSTGARLNRLIIEELQKSWEFKRVRRFTRRNPIAAGMAAIYFSELVLSGLDATVIETANEIFCTEEELRDAMLRKKTAATIASLAATQWAEEDAPDSGGSAGRNREISRVYLESAAQWDLVIEEKKSQLKSLSARLLMQWNTSARKKVGRSGSGEPGDRVGQFATGAEGIGANRGIWTRGDLSYHLKLVEAYGASPKLKRLAEKIGRLKETREHRRGRSPEEEAAEVMGIAFGNDLPLVVPEEWLDYFRPHRKNLFKKRYADEALCLYDMKNRHKKNKGSMVICLDNSGSMQGPKEETAKAIAIALMEIAAAQKRDFVVIMFGGPDDEMKIFEVPKGRCTFEQLVEIGEHFLCSAGTDFEKPLQEAVKILEKDRHGRGDIVFITDGACTVSPEFLERYGALKRTRQFQTTVVLVNYGHISTAAVEAFADELLMSKDLKGVDVADRLFSAVRDG